METRTAITWRRAALLLAAVVLVAWAAWWFDALSALRLRWAEHTWMKEPAFGADFWSQSDYAARLWRGGVDPYEDDRHLFHYPPIVIRLFLWTPFFDIATALRIWVGALMVLVVLATALSARVRARLGAGEVPAFVLLALVLVTFPMIYLFERANFDIVTLAGILLAAVLFEREDPRLEFLAGVLLAFGPWVKIYPGLLGLALLALGRKRALAGFVVSGALIGLSMPTETLESFRVLRMAIGRVTEGVSRVPYSPWSHSLSMAFVRFVHTLPSGSVQAELARVPGSAVAVALIAPLLAWVLLRVHRSGSRDLALPVMLWTVSLASYVPEIANDYSLLFLPLAAACTIGRGDSWIVRSALVGSFVAMQPLALPIPGSLLLVAKVLAVAAVGASIAGRADARNGPAQPVLADGAGRAGVVSGTFPIPTENS